MAQLPRSALLAATLLAAKPAGSSRLLELSNLTLALEGEVEGRYRVDCVTEGCYNTALRGFDSGTFGPDTTYVDKILCNVASQARACGSTPWRYTKMVTKASCAEARGLSKLMFHRGMCREDDLCSAVAARVGLMLAACGAGVLDDYFGSVSFSQATCGRGGEPGDSSWKLHMSVCMQRVARQARSPAAAAEMARSLLCGCESLLPESSRSEAIFQRSQDRLYVVKRTDEEHARRQAKLDIKYPKLAKKLPLLMHNSYLDEHRRIVVMKNAFDADAVGFQANWKLHKPQSCSQVPEADLKVPVENEGGFDVKPRPCKSAERAPLLAHIIRHRWKLKTWYGWQELEKSMKATVRFLDRESLVDYSPLVSFFRASSERPPDVGCAPQIRGSAPPGCIVAPTCVAAPRQGSYGFESAIVMTPGEDDCNFVCFAVIDYLMEFNLGRKIESFFKKGKWNKYAQKTLDLVRCFGDLQNPKCETYLGIGCLELSEMDDVKVEELEWCSGHVRTPTIPPKAMAENGCVPDGKWKDSYGDSCKDYAGMLISVDEFDTRGSRGKNPIEACCAKRNGNRLAYAAAPGMAPGGGKLPPEQPSTLANLTDKFWKDHGCLTDDAWQDSEGRICEEYDGMIFEDEDWQIRGSGQKTPMEACCLDKKGADIVYVHTSWLFNDAREED